MTTIYTKITGSCNARYRKTLIFTPSFILASSNTVSVTTTSGSTSASQTASTSTTASTIPSTTITTTTKPSTFVYSAKTFDITSGVEIICTYLTKSGRDTVASTITTPSGGKYGNYKAFPTTGFMDVAPGYHKLCKYNFGSNTGPSGKDSYCVCSTTVDGSASSQQVPLLFAQGSQTALECAGISSVLFTSTTPTPRTSATQVLITDYTSADIGGDIYNFATAYVTTVTEKMQGDEKDFTPYAETNGVGTAKSEKVPDYVSTASLTTYYYAEATGDGNGDVKPVGTPTAVIAPESTENCVHWLYLPPGKSKYGSRYIEYWMIFWGNDGWDSEDPIDDLKDALDECGVDTSTFISQKDTDKWGSIAMWQNGDLKSDSFDISKCEKKGVSGLGGAHPKCKQIGNGPGVPLKETPEEQTEYINENSNLVKSPYPLDS